MSASPGHQHIENLFSPMLLVTAGHTINHWGGGVNVASLQVRGRLEPMTVPGPTR